MPSNRISGIPPENSKKTNKSQNKQIKAKSVILMALFLYTPVIYPHIKHFIALGAFPPFFEIPFFVNFGARNA